MLLTGRPTAEASAKGNFRIEYKCTHCMKEQIYNGIVKTTARSAYDRNASAAFGDRTAEDAGDEAMNMATVNLVEELERLRDDTNVKKKYSSLSKYIRSVKCPDCSNVQPWSDFPLILPVFGMLQSVGLWLVVQIFTSIIVMGFLDSFLGDEAPGIVMILPIVLVIVYSIVSIVTAAKGGKKLAEIDKLHEQQFFQPPSFSYEKINHRLWKE